MTTPPIVPHPSVRRHAVRSLAPFLDFVWHEGGRHGAPVPDTARTLTHLCAHDHATGYVREVLSDDHTLFGLRFDGLGFTSDPDVRSLDALKRRAVERHLDAICTAKPREARIMLAMLVCRDPGDLARSLSQSMRRPVGVSEDIVPLLWKAIAPA